MQTADLAVVHAIQARCYSGAFVESLAVLQHRLQAAPDTAWVACVQGQIAAYLVGYRSAVGCISALGSGFLPSPTPNCVYLHDLAVAPSGRGLGLGLALVRQAQQQAQTEGLGHLTLVALPEAQGFWHRLGFAATNNLSATAQQQLMTYGALASYQCLSLAQ